MIKQDAQGRVLCSDTEPVFKIIQEPNVCPGCYDLDLYCKYENPDHTLGEFPETPYDVQSYAQAKKLAKKWGWLIHNDGTATCPKCAARLARGEKPVSGPNGKRNNP